MTRPGLNAWRSSTVHSIESPDDRAVTVTTVPKDRKGLAHVPVRAPYHDASPVTASCGGGGGGAVVVVVVVDVVVVVVGGGGTGTWRTAAVGVTTAAVVVVVVVGALVVVVGECSAASAMGAVHLDTIGATAPRAP